MILHPVLDEQGRAVTPVHFLYRSPRGTVRLDGQGLGPDRGETWKVACMPYLGEIDPANCPPLAFQRTEDPRAVTCPWCLKSEEFARCRT